MYRERVHENDRIAYDILVNVLEDERIETRVVSLWPEWRPALKKRWDRLLSRFFLEIQEAQLFQQFGPQSVRPPPRWITSTTWSVTGSGIEVREHR